MTVFLHHANWLGLDFGALALFPRPVGHSAVVIFLVLSGFVIAASVDRNKSGADYAIKRMSRVYSVVIPAVFLTLCIDLVSTELDLRSEAPDYELRKPLLYAALALAFAGDFWSWGIPVFSNNPFWSLNYEVWYYVAFGAAVCLRGTKRAAALALALAIMGPKLWLLFPIWMGGVAVYALQKRVVLPQAVARGAVAAAFALYVLFMASGWNDAVAAFGRDIAGVLLPFPLRFSQWFLADHVVGVLTMVLVWALCSANFAFPPVATALGTSLAKVSFSLYLVHFPLLQFFGALMPGYGPAAVALTFGVAVAFGAVFEPQRERLRRALTALPYPRLL